MFETKVKPPPNSPPITVMDPDDRPMWSSTRTVAPTSSCAIIQLPISNNFHIKADLLKISNLFQYGENQEEAVILRTFPFSLSEEAKTWMNELKEGTITLWNKMREAFISRLTKGTIIQIFYHGLDDSTKGILDIGGIFLYKTPNEAFKILEDKTFADDVLPNHIGDKELKSFDGFKTGRMTKKEKNDNDQGSDVNVMPLSTYKKLTDERLAETDIRLSLASHSYIYPLGITKDVLVFVAGYVYPVDFVILYIKEDEKRTFILGTPLLTIAKAVIKFDKGIVTLRFKKSKISLHRIPESLYKTEKGIKNDIELIAPTMIVNRLFLE
uniref:Reverse transcriptase domain-containing protein n=1 Tax=Tanacetum cinerariifolium TaxID=118510 RepID=A0A6L2ML85_TANCI|nr:hypothetical protein [Tanacetum cinerariifolium]